MAIPPQSPLAVANDSLGAVVRDTPGPLLQRDECEARVVRSALVEWWSQELTTLPPLIPNSLPKPLDGTRRR
jgi:hypothetical protein